MEREEDCVQEGEGSTERVSHSHHGLRSVSINASHNSGENCVGSPVWCVSISGFHHA